jgi:hypothetical protein
MQTLHPSLQGAYPESDKSASECPEKGFLPSRDEPQLPSAGHQPDETILFVLISSTMSFSTGKCSNVLDTKSGM